MSNDRRACRTVVTETNSNVNSTIGVGSSNGSITRSNYSMNNLIAGGTSTVWRERERDKIHNKKKKKHYYKKKTMKWKLNYN